MRAGDTVYVRWHLDIFRWCEDFFQPTFVNLDNNSVTLLTGFPGVQPGKLGEVMFSREVHVPENLLPGKYEYRVEGLFRCNPVRSHPEKYPPVVFRVANGSD